MVASINASTSAGVVTTADTSGILQLQTASTAALTIDASQNVGIGTASPTQKLQVAGNAFISAGQYFMWDNAGAWSLQSDASTYVRTYIAGNEKMRVNAYGIGVGGAIPSSGTGVTFPATQSASSNANTLDDYEEGTWTPSVGGTATYSGQDGKYTKVGNLVTCVFDMTINLIGTGSTQNIINFPFANSSVIATGSVSYYVSLPTATNFISFYIGSSATNCNFVGNTGNATTVGLNGFAVFGNSSRVIGSITYSTS